MDVAPGPRRFRFKFDHNHEGDDDDTDDNDGNGDCEDDDNANAEVGAAEVSEGKLEVSQPGQLGREGVQGHQKQVSVTTEDALLNLVLTVKTQRVWELYNLKKLLSDKVEILRSSCSLQT